jgi:hypothetical protein
MAVSFDPLRNLAFQELYFSYSSIIDFAIYMILFTGISRAVLEKRFPGIPGKLMSIAIGLVLSVSLVITQERFDFSISNFGPLAALLLLLIMGIVIFNLLSSFGFSKLFAASVSFFLLYGGVRSLIPNMFDWLMINIPLLGSVLSLLFILAIVTMFITIWPRFNHGNSSAFIASPIESIPGLQRETKELSEYSEKAEEMAIDVKINEEEIFKRLKQIKMYYPTLIRTPEGAAQLLHALEGVHHENLDVVKKLERLRKLNAAIEQEDLQTFQKIIGYIKKLPKGAYPKAKQAIQTARDRLELEKAIVSLDKNVETFTQKFLDLIQHLGYAIQHRDPSAIRALEAAVRMERPMKKFLEAMDQLEKKLKQAFARSYRQEKKQD